MQRFTLLIALLIGTSAFAQTSATDPSINNNPSFLDEFDPNDPNAEAILNYYDKVYEHETGLPAWVEQGEADFKPFTPGDGCYRDSCKVWAHVSKANQRLYLYIDGRHEDTWLVSSGTGNRTPNFDRHPNGRIYRAYTSKAYPGGDWNGLGNMPYAVFIQGGFAIHGTPQSNWKKLGSKASHGCIRVHPTNGEAFYNRVRAWGIRNVWITVN